MAIIKAKKVPRPESKEMDAEDILARFCYYFPQYTYIQARKMPAIRIRKMLKSARAERSKEINLLLYELVQIMPASNSEKHYKSMLKKYENILRELN